MPDPSDPSVRALAHRILERPEYASFQPDSFLERLFRRILEWLSQIEILRDTAPVLFWMIVAAIGIVIVALLAHIVWALAAALGAPEPGAKTAPRQKPRRDLKAEAEALAAAGSYLEAAHRLMLACFATLAERGLIELRPDRSNRWIRAALHRSGLPAGIAAEIDSLVEGTERRWFGKREDDPEIYLRWRSAFARLSAEAG